MAPITKVNAMSESTSQDESSTPSEAHQEQAATDDDSEYSVFTKHQVTTIVVLVAIAGFFSPFTAFIYFPALQSISQDFAVSIELMNLTVTAYLLVQGIAPSILGDFSEGVGRRPVYLLCFALYCAASIGLVFQRSYGALLVLRMLQSAGSSGTIALAYGVIGDIAAPYKRGTYVGLAHIGFNSAPGLGPVIGGLLADRVGWPWIFVLLAAFSGLVFLLLALFLFETARSVVGNGSVRPTGISRALIGGTDHRHSEDEGPKARWRMPNIIPCFKIVFHKHTFPVLLANATFYMMYSLLQATLASLLQRYYGLSPLQAGLCYLSFGCASPIASYLLGRVTDHDYRVVARKHDFAIDRRRGDDLIHFPIEEARIRTVFIYIALCSTSTMGYGWTIESRTHLSAPLVLTFIIGFTVTGIFTVLNTLVVDVNPNSPATASASVSITRCLTAAGGVAVIEILINAIGPGWAFSVVGALCWLTVLVLLLVRRKGWAWRKALAAT